MRRQYRRKPDQFVVAIQLNLDTEGFTFRKWDDVQRCKPGDWLVDNDGDVYTVDRETFARTYAKVGTGQYRKTTPVWAEVASAPGSVRTQEGTTHHQAGDYLVSNDPEGNDAYAVTSEKFLATYEPVS
jgi:hypothetical protein